jgi:hypothetical protein
VTDYINRSISMSSKDQDRWERLAALGVKSEIPTPEGEDYWNRRTATKE